jgi:DNA-binding MarR family transcriptional regulator
VPAIDRIDEIIAEWRRERPDLDPSAKEVVGRLVRLGDLCQRAYDEAFQPLGLSGADYGILAPLRRAGAPFELTPTELARRTLMTSGGMTSALDRLERRGLLGRRANPNDRRGSLVRLTSQGLELIDAAMAVHADVEHRLVDSLGDTERTRLASGLRRLLLAIDGEG